MQGETDWQHCWKIEQRAPEVQRISSRGREKTAGGAANKRGSSGGAGQRMEASVQMIVKEQQQGSAGSWQVFLVSFRFP